MDLCIEALCRIDTKFRCEAQARPVPEAFCRGHENLEREEHSRPPGIGPASGMSAGVSVAPHRLCSPAESRIRIHLLGAEGK